MILYEVNIEIKNDIYDNYIIWLQEHIQEMLLIDGFLHAKIFNDISGDQKSTKSHSKLSVHYEIENLSKLNHYFNNQAAKMRKQTSDLFGNDLIINRRVLMSC